MQRFPNDISRCGRLRIFPSPQHPPPRPHDLAKDEFITEMGSHERVMVSMENHSPTELRGEVEALKANLDALVQQAEDLFRAQESN
jgi:hypothetical protein